MSATPSPIELPSTTTVRPISIQRIGGWAGIAGPILFTLSYLVHGWVRREEYDWVAEPISALEGGPSGWIQQVTFVLLGVCMLLYAWGLHRAVRRTTVGVIGSTVMLWSGVGLILAAVFPLREDAQGITYDPGGHAPNGLAFFLSIWLGLVLISRRLAADEEWRDLARFVLATGVFCAALFFIMGTLVVPDDGPLHPVLGVLQRLAVSAWLACTVVLARRLLRSRRPG